jgi:probable dihydroxyacetone kinase regulator
MSQMLKTAKYAFADSLKKMLETKTLENITVTNIVQDCGTSRQAFYYHFNDIYNLLEWIYLNEATSLLENNHDFHTWQQGYHLILNWMLNNKPLVVNTYRSISRDYLETFMYNWLFPMLEEVVNKLATGLNVQNENKEFIARFYTLAFIVISLDWVRTGMKETPEAIVWQLEVIVKDNFMHALEKYAE